MSSQAIQQQPLKPTQHLVNIALSRLEQDKLVLPVKNARVMGILSLLADPACTVLQVAESIELEPVCALYVMKQANAGIGTSLSDNVYDAVSKLGLRKVKALLLELSTRPLRQSRDRKIATAAQMLTEHAVAVAVLSRDIASICGSSESAAAYLGGLLHDVGKFVAASMLLEAENVIENASQNRPWIEVEAWVHAIETNHHPIAVALAQEWRMPAVVQTVVNNCKEYDSEQKLSVPNFVRFANVLAKAQGAYVGSVDMDICTAQVMIGRSLLGLDAEVVSRLCADLRGRVQSMLEGVTS
jgi:putative nucleotidyltransferase with HDIG domain